MSTFLLVHGSFHGPRCWDRLVAELGARGRRAVAVDLPSADPLAGYDACTKVVGDALSNVDDAVLVGHSYGGLLLPVVASHYEVARLVYLAAFVPVPGRSLMERSGEPGAGGPPPEALALHDDGTASFSPEHAGDVFYGDCSDDDRAWAIANLRRQGLALAAEPCPITSMPAVPTDHVVLDDDRAIPPEWCRWMARELLGVEPHELRGGHSPFLAQPAVLADLLGRLA